MRAKIFLALVVSSLFFGCTSNSRTSAQQTGQQPTKQSEQQPSRPIQISDDLPPLIKQMLANAMEQTKITKQYDPNYTVLAYPNGDVPLEKGVCTDVVIRAMRAAKVDLQKEVHEDMRANFAVYPKKWGLKRADSNIDHRRVPNLHTFFTRRNKSLAITDQAANYKPGDVVAWDLNGKGLTHIGVVSNLWNDATKRYLIIHNIGRGAQTEDVLFDWKIIGHYRYF